MDCPLLGQAELGSRAVSCRGGKGFAGNELYWAGPGYGCASEGTTPSHTMSRDFSEELFLFIPDREGNDGPKE